MDDTTLVPIAGNGLLPLRALNRRQLLTGLGAGALALPSAALAAAGVEHEFHRYDDAGHGFQTFTNPDRYVEHVSEDAWGKVLAFLGRKLG